MENNIIHYVEETKATKFVWNVEKTLCGLSYDKINEYSTNVKYVNCKKCLKLKITNATQDES